MFSVGDYIVYGHNGICQVVDITYPALSGIDKNKLYYVLVPEKTRDSKLFCPTDNDRVVIRKVISAEEAKAILNDAKELEPMIVLNDRQRDDSYKSALKSCDLRTWVRVLKALLIRKKEREESGKKVTATDERFIKLAEEGLVNELSLATGTDNSIMKEMLLANCQ